MHLKIHFQVSAAAFFSPAAVSGSDFSQDIHLHLGRIEFGLIDDSIFTGFFFSACTLFSFYPTQRK